MYSSLLTTEIKMRRAAGGNGIEMFLDHAYNKPNHALLPWAMYLAIGGARLGKSP